MGVIAFAGPVGAIASGTYFMANLLTTGATGKSIGEHIDNNFHIFSTGALPGCPFMVIPKLK